MTQYRDLPSCFPSHTQTDLLRAALLDGPDMRAAWKRWRAVANIERLDYGSNKLLPLLYRNLRDHDIDDPVLPRLKGVYQSAWYVNHLLFHHTAALIRLLRDAGIPSMLLKGAALTQLAYRDMGLRPMEDVDLLVPTAQTRDAVALLRERGWRATPPLPRVLESAYLATKHGYNFMNTSGQVVDLHWHAMDECLCDGDDDDFWDAAADTDLRGESTLALGPTDQLLHTCVHGVKWNPVPPIRWAADAIALLRGFPRGLDWDRLVHQACRRRLVLPVRAGLTYLRDRLDAPVPDDALNALVPEPAAAQFEEIQYRIRTGTPSDLGPFWRVLRQQLRYRRLTHLMRFGARAGPASSFCLIGTFELFRDVIIPRFTKPT